METELKEKEQMQLKYTNVTIPRGLAGEVIIASEELIDDPEPVASRIEEETCSIQKSGGSSENVRHAPSQESEERYSRIFQ